MRLFVIALGPPWCEYEIVSYDKTTGVMKMRGFLGDVEVTQDTSPEAQAARKLHWRYEKRQDDGKTPL